MKLKNLGDIEGIQGQVVRHQDVADVGTRRVILKFLNKNTAVGPNLKKTRLDPFIQGNALHNVR